MCRKELSCLLHNVVSLLRASQQTTASAKMLGALASALERQRASYLLRAFPVSR